MKKFLVLYHASGDAAKQIEESTPEQSKDGMKPWMDWVAKCGDGIVDLGTPLGNAHSMSKNDHGKSDSTVTGYSILQAESWDDIKTMTEGHPHLQWSDECSLEVHECLPMPGM
jgi:hypothetical protein